MSIQRFAFVILTVLLSLPLPCVSQSNRKVKAKFTWQIDNTENTSDLILRIMVPTTIEGRQTVHSVQVSEKPDDDMTDNTGCRYLVFDFGSKAPRNLVMEVSMTLHKSGLGTSKRKHTEQPEAKYLASEEYIESDNPRIIALADSLKAQTETETVKNIMAFLAKTLTYDAGERYTRQGNLVTLAKGTGLCNDYADLMIALCRANGIPARLSGGYLFNRDFIPGWDNDNWHVWVDVYLSEYGWVPFEPTRNEIQGWQSMPPQYIYLAQDLANSHINSTFNYSYKGWPPRIDSFFNIK